MARLAGKNSNFAFNSVQIEDELNTMEMNVDVELPEVTAFGDLGGTFVEGLPTAQFSVAGHSDFASGQGDATIFGQIGSGAAAAVFQPTGNSPNTNDPNYQASAFVKSYRVRSSVKGSVEYDTRFQVSGVVTRDVAP